MSEEAQWEKFDAAEKRHKQKQQGMFGTIHDAQSSHGYDHRRLYVSSRALEWLDYPEYVEFYIDRGRRRLAINPTNKGADQAYKRHGGGHTLSIELPLRELNVKVDLPKRVPLHPEPDNDWLYMDFLGGVE